MYVCGVGLGSPLLWVAGCVRTWCRTSLNCVVCPCPGCAGKRLVDSTNTPEQYGSEEGLQRLSKTAGSRKKVGIRKSQISGPLELMDSPEVSVSHAPNTAPHCTVCCTLHHMLHTALHTAPHASLGHCWTQDHQALHTNELGPPEETGG